ncbi:hypothetical protein ACJ73_07722 [Blastomyces percursus]|uniref:Uncharacterized protein n=1 Tax=Blastomyces percursus TaxID=1658174 RepID=A0A1J9R040_9EURO|nr:hypothetical protein ACJ73_07722 [Blastomyces percursus]
MSDRAFHVWLRAPSETPVGASINGGLEHLPPPVPPSGESRSRGGCRNPGVPRGLRFRLGSVDCWPLANVSNQIPGGKPAPEAAARQRVRGRDPPSEGPMRQTGSPSRVGARPCRGPSSEDLSGGN